MADDASVIELRALEALDRIDCPEPRCRRNARSTGRLLRRVEEPMPGWYMECRCADCNVTFTRRTLAIEELAAAIVASAPEHHERIARAWIAGGGK